MCQVLWEAGRVRHWKQSELVHAQHGDWEMAQSGKCSLLKQEDLGSILRTPVKKQVRVCSPSTEEAETGASLGHTGCPVKSTRQVPGQ